MVKALEKYSSPSDTFIAPSPDPDLGNLPPVLQGNWNGTPSQGVHDILYWVNKDNPRGGAGGNPADSQYAYWEYPVQLWAQSNGTFTGVGGGVNAVGPVPTVSVFSIISPVSGSYVPWGQQIGVAVSLPTDLQIQQVTYYLDGGLAGSVTQPPFSMLISPNQHGPAQLRAVATTPNGPVESNTTFTVQ